MNVYFFEQVHIVKIYICCANESKKKILGRFVNMRGIAPTLKNYKVAYLKNDIMAGLIVAAVSIPISMGYAQIAGLPACYGLYGSVIPILLFALCSTSKQFIIGVDAAPAALVGGTLASMGIASGSKEALEVVPLITLFVAVWLFVFSFFEVGKLVNYISKPVMGGFISGIAFTIILMQVSKLMGHGTVTGELFEILYGISLVLGEINIVSLILGIGTIVIILVLKKIAPKFPMSVIMMGIGVLLTKFAHIDEKYGVALLSSVEKGLPKLYFFSGVEIDYLVIIESAFSIALVITASSLLAEDNFAAKNGYTIQKNREIFAFGFGNLGSALIGGCPINGSVSRTSMTEQFEGKSQMTSIVAGISMLGLLLCGTGFIQYLPVPILTGIVMAALWGVMEIGLAKRLAKESKTELIIFLGAFFGVLIFGTIAGVVIGICLSFVDVLIRTTNSPRCLLGVVPGKSGFHSLERSSGAREIEHTVIYRFRGNIFFANFDKFEGDILAGLKEDTKYVIVDAGGVNDIDMSASDGIVQLNEKLKARGIQFFITEHKGEINDKFRQYGAQQLIEEGVARRTISAALRDVHVYPPYPLVDNSDEHMTKVMLADNRSINEFEWAYGKDAERYMELYTAEVIENLSDKDHINLSKGWYLEHNRTKKWHKLGYVDEMILLYHLENHLSEVAAKMSKGEAEIEEALERRRSIILSRLKEENKDEFNHLHDRFMLLENRMKREHPELYRDIVKIREKIKRKENEL